MDPSKRSLLPGQVDQEEMGEAEYPKTILRVRRFRNALAPRIIALN